MLRHVVKAGSVSSIRSYTYNNADVMLAIIWLDHGKDLGVGAANVWLASPLRTRSWGTIFLPVVQHHYKLAKGNKLSNVPDTTQVGKLKVPQSASGLHRSYGQSLNPQVAFHDSFYALSEIFAFAAASEMQFLNLLKDKIANEIDSNALRSLEDRSLSNLSYTKHILDRHTLRLEENIRSLETCGSSFWPQIGGLTDTKLQAKAAESSKSLLDDYVFLLSYAKELSRRCESGLQLVMQYVMLRESQKAIEQAAGVTRLTRLAFIYIPLSFTATLFGMNFKQLG